MTLPRLSRDTLARLVRRPEFDPARVTTGIRPPRAVLAGTQ